MKVNTATSSLAAVSRCANCRYFANDSALLEQSIPGFRVMGSGYSAVRANDGICARHERYLSADYGCADFEVQVLGE